MTSFPKRGKDVRNLWFKVLNIDRTTNSIEVECHSFDGSNVFPEVWSLDSTEAGFEVGDYKLIK